MAKQLNVKPNIGIRIKLASSGSGKWEDSGGDASKFGLSSSELLEALDFMADKGMQDCLKLIHFHIGSQVTKIRRIKTALREASQFYVQLHSMGFKVEFVDIGGGLGVDYDIFKLRYLMQHISLQFTKRGLSPLDEQFTNRFVKAFFYVPVQVDEGYI
jgi:arginine decarboxylase